MGKGVVYPAWNTDIMLKKAKIEISRNGDDWDVESMGYYYNTTRKAVRYRFGYPCCRIYLKWLSEQKL